MKDLSNIKISVVTVTRNSELLLEKTIKSVIEQKFNEFEYIVIDGASIDNTHEILAKYADKLSKVVSETDTGIYNAMNKSLKYVTGKWVIFLNAGDLFYDDNTLLNAWQILKNTNCDLVYGDIYRKKEDGELIHKTAEEPRYCHRMFFCHQALFCKSELLRSFPFDENHKYSADFKFVRSMILNHQKFLHIDLPVALFDTTGASSVNRNKGLLDNISVIAEMDTFWVKLRLLPRLYFKVYWNKLRGKS